MNLLNFRVFCVCGTVEIQNNTTKLRDGSEEKNSLRCNNVKFKPLVDSQNVFLPPLHFKLGLMKNFVKAMDRNGEGFKHLRTVFSGLSDAKLKGVFIGPQIKK